VNQRVEGLNIGSIPHDAIQHLSFATVTFIPSSSSQLAHYQLARLLEILAKDFSQGNPITDNIPNLDSKLN
jgi:hypothetical protein